MDVAEEATVVAVAAADTAAVEEIVGEEEGKFLS